MDVDKELACKICPKCYAGTRVSRTTFLRIFKLKISQTANGKEISNGGLSRSLGEVASASFLLNNRVIYREYYKIVLIWVTRMFDMVAYCCTALMALLHMRMCAKPQCGHTLPTRNTNTLL